MTFLLKGIESLPQTLILYSLYPCNLKIFEQPEFIVRNIYGIQHCKDIGISKSDFVANTQFLCQIKKLNLF